MMVTMKFGDFFYGYSYGGILLKLLILRLGFYDRCQ